MFRYCLPNAIPVLPSKPKIPKGNLTKRIMELNWEKDRLTKAGLASQLLSLQSDIDKLQAALGGRIITEKTPPATIPSSAIFLRRGTSTTKPMLTPTSSIRRISVKPVKIGESRYNLTKPAYVHPSKVTGALGVVSEARPLEELSR